MCVCVRTCVLCVCCVCVRACVLCVCCVRACVVCVCVCVFGAVAISLANSLIIGLVIERSQVQCSQVGEVYVGLRVPTPSSMRHMACCPVSH